MSDRRGCPAITVSMPMRCLVDHGGYHPPAEQARPLHHLNRLVVGTRVPALERRGHHATAVESPVVFLQRVLCPPPTIRIVVSRVRHASLGDRSLGGQAVKVRFEFLVPPASVNLVLFHQLLVSRQDSHAAHEAAQRDDERQCSHDFLLPRQSDQK